MSRWSKIAWFVGGISLLILIGARFVLGGWLDYLWAPLGLFFISVIAALVMDFKFYSEFLGMRTTKHGMNMGVLILLVLMILTFMNVISVRKDKTWDLTEEKLFSLSDQSRTLLKASKSEVQIVVLYRGKKDSQAKEEIKGTLGLFEEASDKVKVRFYDAFADLEKADEYLKGLSDTGQPFLFVEFNGKRVRADAPYTEQNITQAIIKATRRGDKKIYFLTGHGERDLNSDETDGLKEFKATLEGSAYQVEKLNLLQAGKIPEDTAILAIVGPQTQIQEGEFQLMSDYARKGGRFFIAVDPGLRHQISLFLRRFGVEFKNNYIVNDRIQLQGRGAGGALGLIFDKTSPITKDFNGRENFTLFDTASEVIPASDGPAGVVHYELVKTPPVSYTVQDLKGTAKEPPRRMVGIGVVSSGKWPSINIKADGKSQVQESSEKFKAVVFGDSDFVTQKDLLQGLNMDLALNSIADLAEETDLISIMPKQPKGTRLTMTTAQRGFVVIGGVSLPIILIILGGLVWYRRRGA